MDKYEYNLRNEEINTLISRREFQKAVAIADTIDWTKVRSVKTLCKISDLYKVNRRYKESRILLEQALVRFPNGKSIVSSLCELCIKMDDIIGAMEYYKQFVQMAPTDNLKFILLYKIYEAQEATLDERIEVLEGLKKRERIEKWCYELAYLYHRTGLTTKCVEECDDLILWFREGKYVKKAMELKMLHGQLTQPQDVLYQNMLDPEERATYVAQSTAEMPVEEIKVEEADDVLVKTVDVGQYSTINIQKALEESIKGTLGSNEAKEEPVVDNIDTYGIVEQGDDVTRAIIAPMLQDTSEMQELFFEENNDQTEETAGVSDDNEMEAEVVSSDEANESSEIDDVEDIATQVAFPDVPVSSDTLIYNKGDIVNQVASAVLNEQKEDNAENINSAAPTINMQNASQEELMELIDRKVAEALENAMKGQSMTANVEPRREYVNRDVPPRSMQKMLSQEYNGQIEFVIPEQEQVEKQITGQINLGDYLESWEDTKRQNQQMHEEMLKKQLLQETGNLLSDFEAQARDSILEKIQKEEKEAKEASTPIDADKEYEEYIKKIIAESEAEDEKAGESEATTNVEENTESDEAASAETEKELESEAKESEAEANEQETEEPEAEAKEPEDEAKEPEAEDLVTENVESSDAEPEAEKEDSENKEEADEIEEIEEPEDEIRFREMIEKARIARENDPNFNKTESEEEMANSENSDNNEDDEAEKVADGSAKDLSEEEITLFSQFFQTKKARQQLMKSLDEVSLASYTGNVFVTGDMGDEPVELAKNVVQYVKMSDANFSGKIGKVTGASLNGKDIANTIEKMSNGGLIIERAGDMRDEKVQELIKVLNQENLGVLVVMQDTKTEMNKMFSSVPDMNEVFNVHIEIEELSDDALVAFGRKYAERMEYSIDEMGILALHTRIDEMQTSDHMVTVADVREIVDEAIDHATRFSPKHITDILFGKRYDDEDMIILKERDFIN